MILLQNNEKLRNALIGAFLSVSGMALGGCTTTKLGPCMRPDGVNLGVVSITKTTYDGKCAAIEAGKQMMQIPDAGARATGILLVETNNEHAKAAGTRVRDALANQGEQKYIVRRNPDGSAVLVGGAVVTVPKVETDPATAAPAPAPKM